MKNERIREFKNQAEGVSIKESTKFIVKWLFFITILLSMLFIIAGKALGCSTIEFLSDNIIFVVCIIFLSILFIIGYSYDYKKSIYSKTYDKLLKDFSRATAEIMFIPNIPLEIILVNPRDSAYQDLIDKLPNGTKFYGILKKDNKIYVYIKLPNDGEKFMVDIVSKKDFMEYYKFIHNWE